MRKSEGKEGKAERNYEHDLEDMISEKVEQEFEELRRENRRLREDLDELKNDNRVFRKKLEKFQNQNVDRTDLSKIPGDEISRRDFIKKAGIGAIGFGALSLTPSAASFKITKDGIFDDNNKLFGGNNGNLDVDKNIRINNSHSIQDGSGNNRLELNSGSTILNNDAGNSGIQLINGGEHSIYAESGTPLLIKDTEGSFNALKYTTGSSKGKFALRNANLQVENGTHLSTENSVTSSYETGGRGAICSLSDRTIGTWQDSDSLEVLINADDKDLISFTMHFWANDTGTNNGTYRYYLIADVQIVFDSGSLSNTGINVRNSRNYSSSDISFGSYDSSNRELPIQFSHPGSVSGDLKFDVTVVGQGSIFGFSGASFV